MKVESQQNARKERQKDIHTYLPNRRRLFRVTPPTVRQNDCTSFEDWLRGLRVLSSYRWRVISNPLLTPPVRFAAESRTTRHTVTSKHSYHRLSLTRAKLWSNPQKFYTRGDVAIFAHIRTKLWPVTSFRGVQQPFSKLQLAVCTPW